MKLNTLISLLLLVSNFAEARKGHDEGKSDPSRNVGTGQALYRAQQALDDALDKLGPEAFSKMMADAKRGEIAVARALELEQRFAVTACPRCGTLGRRGHSHVYGHVTGSHIEYESCNGLEK